ncbi:DUF6231 family protein [Psychrobacter sp. ANT_WB68]|uniref:DUF6231 family protein n=1 Tax=Psychrobacter sp. ANT_WB68 TaxID=2597355 RepID=UPI0011F1669E|nr:DUF6231 family protein [Psychrobacter sp. ANT_WB68]KAA0915706.1 hypothetical protein FQ084_03990 [Psychrobacter sp. ANT_WB68]
MTTYASNITLPLLSAYIDALLPSLAMPTRDEVSEQLTSVDNHQGGILWVVPDKKERLNLQAQLADSTAIIQSSCSDSFDSSNDNNDGNNDEMAALPIVTLTELTQQTLPERYKLACFWLPTLSAELLQQYVPLLMRYRDIYAAHLLIVLDEAIDLRAYGLTPFDILSEPSLEEDITHRTTPSLLMTSPPISATLWQFNLYDYKQLPNWLNADYWANPESWGKHRW